MKRIDPDLCARCKGYKRLCGLPRCPILQRLRAFNRARWEGHVADAPSPPSPLVGESGYPKVPLALSLSPYGDPRLRDAPTEWVRMRLGLEEVANLRMEMLNPFKKVDVRRVEELLDNEVIWAGISEKPVDVEARIEGKVIPPKLDGLIAPIGPSARAQEVKVQSNPKVDSLIERKFEERIKAEVALRELYEYGRDVYALQKALSLGLLGKRKKLVPTRWAITAVDQIISKHLKETILKRKWVNSIHLGTYEHYSNRYIVILKPGPPIVEMFEIWKKGTLWSPNKDVIIYNYEGPLPTSKASDPSDGGFHATKAGALQALAEEGTSASVLVIREISKDYYLPLGVWQVREGVKLAVRNALSGIKLDEREFQKIVLNEMPFLSSSKLLSQRKLMDYES
ncbi:hypothetical protein EYM_04255 [Ignicoccus islandicus DSM 13165]|uniref:DNA repair protein n=1 Tax=Ignicoccus islandicus DSM 13165 TaxID=940295 RepID=A0A0U3DW87_9CREN|nr:Nre family DNA repair protein [Ignicoccus islandicus]ALU11738.1 hypothetical protein EYM_04255 [Ignicoccus islandicus DSM 13165]